MKSLIRLLGLLVVVMGVVGCAGNGRFAQDGPGAPKITTETFVYEGKARPYAVYTPANYDPRKKYPTILFLHGLFEGGSNGSAMTSVGIGPALRKRPERFNCIVVMPQAAGSWKNLDEQPAAIAALDEAMKHYAIDPARVTLTGLSTGGVAVWNLGARYPHRFAALAPLCAYSAYDDVPKLTRHPIWAISNSTDPFVPASNTHEMAKRINDAGGNVRKTIYNAFGHNCWDAAYANEQFVAWLQSPASTVGTHHASSR